MAKALTLEQAAKVGIWFVVSTALVLTGIVYAGRLIHHDAPGVRIGGVLLATASLIPFLGFAGWGLSIADEYNRRTLVAGTAVAFAISILYSVAMDALARARVIDFPVAMSLPIAFLLWSAGVGLVWIYEKRRGIR